MNRGFSEDVFPDQRIEPKDAFGSDDDNEVHFNDKQWSNKDKNNTVDVNELEVSYTNSE